MSFDPPSVLRQRNVAMFACVLAAWSAGCGRLQFESIDANSRDSGDGGNPESGADTGDVDSMVGDGGDIDAGDAGGPANIHIIPNTTLLASGALHNCVGLFGRVYCWGDNAFGQLGDGTTMDRSAPTQLGSINNVVALGLGEEHSCALTRIGAVMCWGRNNHGQLGDGTTIDRARPTQVLGFESGIEALWVGAFHACAKRGTGIACWGRNDHAQLGSGNTTERIAPIEIDTFTNVESLALAADASCALRSDRSLQCLGSNANGQLGRGTTSTTDALSAGAVPAITNVRALAAGHHHFCSLHPDGTVHCWGDNRRSECGNDMTVDSLATPDKVAFLGTARTIAASEHTSCVADESGVAKCWGANVAGSATDRRVPVSIAGVDGVRDVSVGRAHQCMRLANNYVHCVGNNAEGQLGDTTRTSSTTAVQVLGLPAPVSGAAPRCGDEFITGTETCDEGRETLRCNANCSLSRCGDGIVNEAAGETCEIANDADAGTCLPDCTLP